MTIRDLHILPKVRDSLSYLYLEHGRIDQSDQAISFRDASGETHVPVASLALLMLGPGTDITHAAVRTLAANNCLVVWCGEENVRFYAWGNGGTRGAGPLLYQAWLASDPVRRLGVVRRMYAVRFGDDEALDEHVSIEQLRGREGQRVRTAYARLSREHGVHWQGREYDRSRWDRGDPANRALSAANACLYGVCQAAILSVGLSPGIGFIHTGKQLSFVYDVADLYKVELTVPIAFTVAASPPAGAGALEREVRRRCRDAFREGRLLGRIVPDLWRVLGEDPRLHAGEAELDEDPALPTAWWGPESADGEMGLTG